MAASKKVLGLPPTVFLLGLVSFANDLSSDMIYPLLPVFLTSIGASMPFIGLIEGVAESTASVLKLFSGWMADRIGRRRLLTVAGYGLSNAIRPLVALASAGWHVLLLRFADRVGKGVRTAPRDAIVAACTPAGMRGRAFGFHRAMDHAGALFGALAVFLLMNYAGVTVRGVFLLAAVPGAAAVALVLAGIGAAPDPPAERVSAPRLSLRPFDRRFKLLLGILALFALGNSSDAFLLLRARDVGIPVTALPLAWMALHAVKALSSTSGGALSDRFGRAPVVVAGWAVYALVYLGFARASSPLHVWLLMAAYGLFHGLTEGTEKALVADLIPPSLRGMAFGVYHFTLGIAALPASVLCGWLWSAFSPAAALGAGAALAAAASAALLLLNARGLHSQAS